ncbi:RHS repeat protein [Ralstonia solanacearum]|nr:RHS repeat protein [Ralstonia pseudosolanacearum]
MSYHWLQRNATTYNGKPYGNTTAGGSPVVESYYCPDGWQDEPNLKSGTGSPRYYEPYCYQDQLVQQCPEGSCHGQGEPIFPEDGTYRQSDLDYIDPRGVLSFERYYNSSQRNMGSTLSRSVLTPDPKPFANSLGGLSYSGTISHLQQYFGDNTTLVRTFRYINIAGVTGTQTTDQSGIHTANQIQVARAGGLFYDYKWDGTTATAVSPSTHDILRFTPPPSDAGSGSGAAAVGGQWTLRRAINDETERYDANGVLQQIQYRNGQTKTLTYSDASTPTNIAPGPGYLIGIKDAFGKALSLRYDSYGRLATLTDPAGQAVTYGYELAQPRWNCTSADCFRIKTVTYQDGKTKTYHWDEADYNPNATTQRNLLTGVTDENSQRYSTIRYDSKGQAMSTELAGGVFRYTFSNLQPRTSVTVTDPLGTARTFNFVNAAGLTQLSSLTGAACDDCGPASATYDSKGNVASQTDFNGTVTCFGYDLTRNLETARVEGLPAGTACPSSLDGYTVPAGARKTTTQWHPVWRQPVKVAQPKQTTTYTFNGDGSQYCAPTSAKVDDTPIGVVCSQTEQPTEDSTGQQGFSATATGMARTTQWTYDDDGQVLTVKGSRADVNDQVSFSYRKADDTATPPQFRRGDLARVVDALGHVTTFDQTDLNGRPLQMTDANGVVTTFTYAPRGWLTSQTVTPAGGPGQVTGYTYDSVGQLIKVTQPDGSSIGFTYDGAHRLTGVSDSQGNSISYTLDAIGNRTQEQAKDSSGTLSRQITRVIDSLNRLQKVTVGTTQ